jgi:soluble lytic murein transglycosylase
MGSEATGGLRLRARPPLWLGVALAALAAGTAPARPDPSAVPGRFDAVDAALLARPGAALRHALDSIEAGETERAERLLVSLAQRHPVIGDFADLERLRIYVLTGRADDALALGEGWGHPDSPLRSQVYGEIGRVRAERGEEEAARAAFDLALASDEDSGRRAEFLLELARSYGRSELPEEAAERYLELWVRYPLTPAAAAANPALEALEVALERRLRSADRYRGRGDVLLRARRNEAALEAYDRALELEDDLDAADRRRAQRQRAQTLFRLRRYTDAARAFSELPQDADTRIAQARARARAGDVAGAAEELERIAAEVRGSQGAYAKLLAALLWEGEDEMERSHALFASLAAGGTGTSYGAAALWRLGWEAYRAGRYEVALEHLGRLAERDTDPISGLRARYWYARAAERAGRPGAAESFGFMAREFPLSYYGWRASARAEQGPSEVPALAIERGEAALAPRQLMRPRILLEAGRLEAAHAELDRLFARVEGLDDRLALAELYANAGDFHRPQRLIVGAYRESLARGPAPGALELWWHAWPAPYLDAVLGATESRAALEPELVYAIMREESGYRPGVRSVSGARGLLQLMPETAERVARLEALEGFRADDLFVPNVNIRLGAAYLDELLVRFSGRASVAIGGYNAGPHRVVRWLDAGSLEESSAHTLDDDEWVESIPYDQTRGYVKRVLRSVHAYRVLY